MGHRGSFVWYDVPKDVWPAEFRLVVCDGPPGDMKGGRYGLLPLVGARLPPGLGGGDHLAFANGVILSGACTSS